MDSRRAPAGDQIFISGFGRGLRLDVNPRIQLSKLWGKSELLREKHSETWGELRKVPPHQELNLPAVRPLLATTTAPSCCQEQTAETIFSTWKTLKPLARPSGCVEEMTRCSSGVLDPHQATAALYFHLPNQRPNGFLTAVRTQKQNDLIRSRMCRRTMSSSAGEPTNQRPVVL